MRQVFPTSPWLLLSLQADVMSYLQPVWKQPLNVGALPPLFPSQASMLWSPLPPRALAVPPAVGKTHGPAAPARSRNHVSCHYLHYLDQLCHRPSSCLSREMLRKEERSRNYKALLRCSANPTALLAEHLSSDSLKRRCFV